MFVKAFGNRKHDLRPSLDAASPRVQVGYLMSSQRGQGSGFRDFGSSWFVKTKRANEIPGHLQAAVGPGVILDGTSLWLSGQAALIYLEESRSSTSSPLGTIDGASRRDWLSSLKQKRNTWKLHRTCHKKISSQGTYESCSSSPGFLPLKTPFHARCPLAFWPTQFFLPSWRNHFDLGQNYPPRHSFSKF